MFHQHSFCLGTSFFLGVKGEVRSFGGKSLIISRFHVRFHRCNASCNYYKALVASNFAIVFSRPVNPPHPVINGVKREMG